MNKKYVYIFMQLFTSICLISVGFASWTFVSGDSITATGNIVAQDVHSTTDYVELTNQTKLKYYKSGFVASDNTISKTGFMSVEYTLNIANCKTLYPSTDFNTLKVLLYLDAIDYNIFSDTTITFEIFNAELQEITSNNSLIVNESKHCLEFYLINILTDQFTDASYSFTVNYYFTVDTYENYENNIYPNIAKLNFGSSALINGENYEQ